MEDAINNIADGNNDEIQFDPHIETLLLIKDFYTSFIISEMYKNGMIKSNDYLRYLKSRGDILFAGEEESKTEENKDVKLCDLCRDEE